MTRTTHRLRRPRCAGRVDPGRARCRSGCMAGDQPTPRQIATSSRPSLLPAAPSLSNGSTVNSMICRRSSFRAATTAHSDCITTSASCSDEAVAAARTSDVRHRRRPPISSLAHTIESTRPLARQLGTWDNRFRTLCTGARSHGLLAQRRSPVSNQPARGSLTHRMLRAPDRNWSEEFDQALLVAHDPLPARDVATD